MRTRSAFRVPFKISNAKPGKRPPARCLSLPQNHLPPWPQPGPAVSLLSEGRLAQASPASPRLPGGPRENPGPLPSGWGLACGASTARRWALGRNWCPTSGRAPAPALGWLHTAGHSQLPEAATRRGSWPQPPPSTPATAAQASCLVQGGLPTSGPPAVGGASTGSGVPAWTSGGGGRVIVPRTTLPEPEPKTKPTKALTLAACPSLRDYAHSHTFHPRIRNLH